MMNSKQLILMVKLIVVTISVGFNEKHTTLSYALKQSSQGALFQKSYPFSLPDSTGKEVTMDDFLGKVVVLEFWFTGCAPCIALAKSMEPVIDYFVDNKDIAFVSINLDSKEITWLNSLSNGVRFRYKHLDEHVNYVHSHAISLSTFPAGFEHPITNYYDIVGVPVLILIGKEGEILDRNPPRPKFTEEKSIHEFIRLLETYLHRSSESEESTPLRNLH